MEVVLMLLSRRYFFVCLFVFPPELLSVVLVASLILCSRFHRGKAVVDPKLLAQEVRLRNEWVNFFKGEQIKKRGKEG